MAEFPDKGTAQWWASEIQKALEWRKKRSFENRWPDIQNYYENRFKKPLDPKFNLIYMLASSTIPAMVFQSPTIVNTARRPEFLYWAGFFDGIDNWLMDEIEVQEIAEEAVLSAFLFNTAGLQLGYDYPEDIDYLATMQEMDFKPVKGSLDRTRKTNQPWIDMILPHELILAPGTKSMRSCSWFGKFLMLPTSILKTLKGVHKSKVKATHVPKEVLAHNTDKWKEDVARSESYTAFWEIHEAETQTFFWIDTNGIIIMGPEKDELQVDGLPLRVLFFNRSTGSLWGTPDSLYIETQMLEGNECRRDGRLQRRAALIKCFNDVGILKEADVEKFLTGDPMVMIPVDIPTDKDISQVLSVIQTHVQIEYFEYERQLLNDAQLLTGNGPNQFGTFASGRRSKYETRIVEERNLLRSGTRRQRLGDQIGELAGMMNQLIVKNWKAPVVAKVVGIEGAIHWVKALPAEFKDIRAQLATRVNVESMIPVSRERRKQEMIDVMAVLAKIQGVNILPIVNSFLSTFDWADVTNTLPQATQQPVGLGEFQSQQQGLAKSPNLGQMLQTNLGGLGRMINALPTGQMGGGE